MEGPYVLVEGLYEKAGQSTFLERTANGGDGVDGWSAAGVVVAERRWCGEVIHEIAQDVNVSDDID